MSYSFGKSEVVKAAKLSVAPMMEWTDRHCRFFHRLMSRHTLLYTEMVTAPALVRGGALHLLEFNAAEHPVAVQLGGSDPTELAEATRICNDHGYDEVNLNVGCPSDRVQSGCFGAVLMEQPGMVADCVAAMTAASKVEVTVKCRIGVDEQDPEQVLPEFLARISAAGIQRVTIHARKAWLKGLSPKENREIPPLDYELVRQMKATFPSLHISVNGGIADLQTAKAFLDTGLDGAMIGRAAYHNPADILQMADRDIYGDDVVRSRAEIVEMMRPYIADHLQSGGRMHQITRHMLGLFAGQPGARHWRRVLSDGATRTGADLELLDLAMAQLPHNVAAG